MKLSKLLQIANIDQSLLNESFVKKMKDYRTLVNDMGFTQPATEEEYENDFHVYKNLRDNQRKRRNKHQPNSGEFGYFSRQEKNRLIVYKVYAKPGEFVNVDGQNERVHEDVRQLFRNYVDEFHEFKRKIRVKFVYRNGDIADCYKIGYIYPYK